MDRGELASNQDVADKKEALKRIRKVQSAIGETGLAEKGTTANSKVSGERIPTSPTPPFPELFTGSPLHSYNVFISTPSTYLK